MFWRKRDPGEPRVVITAGEHLTCSAGHQCAVFNRDIVFGDKLRIEDLKSVQWNFRLRDNRIFPPCFECGRMVADTEGNLHVGDRWVPNEPSYIDSLKMIEGMES